MGFTRGRKLALLVIGALLAGDAGVVVYVSQKAIAPEIGTQRVAAAVSTGPGNRVDQATSAMSGLNMTFIIALVLGVVLLVVLTLLVSRSTTTQVTVPIHASEAVVADAETTEALNELCVALTALGQASSTLTAASDELDAVSTSLGGAAGQTPRHQARCRWTSPTACRGQRRHLVQR